MNLKRILGLLLVLAMIVAACGSDDDAGTDEPAETTAAAEEPADEPADEPAETTVAEEEPGETTTTAAQEFEDVGLLVVNNMAHLPVFVAQDFGLWAARGLNVDVQTLGSGADIAAGLEAGQAEFGAVNGGTGVAPQRAGGLLTKLVAPYNSDATDAKYVKWIGIVGRADRGITDDPQSLAGKVVGVTGGGTPRAYLTEWLGLNGLAEEDLEIVTMSAPDMRTAVVNGEVDAVVPWDPFRTAALRELGDNAVEISAGESLVLSSIGLGAVDGQLDSNPDVFKRFVEGIVEATFMIRQDPEAIAPTVLNFIDSVTAEDAIEAMNRNTYDPRVSVCILYGAEVTAQQLVDAGRFEVDAPFTGEDLVDSRIVDEVIAEHPEWVADLPPLPETVEECNGFEG